MFILMALFEGIPPVAGGFPSQRASDAESQQLIVVFLANKGEIIKGLHYWPFVQGIHKWQVDPPRKGQWCVRPFHVMIS